jgi:hypothetical protein
MKLSAAVLIKCLTKSIDIPSPETNETNLHCQVAKVQGVLKQTARLAMYQIKVRQGHGSAVAKPAEPSADTLNPFDADSRRQDVNKQSSIPTVAYLEDLDRIDSWDAAPP